METTTATTSPKLLRRQKRKATEKKADASQAQDPYTVPLLWLDTVITKKHLNECIEWFSTTEDAPGIRVKYVRTYTTLPGAGGPGGRYDPLFFIHKDDVAKFVIKRVTQFHDMKWLQDMLDNDPAIYCDELHFVGDYVESFDHLQKLKARKPEEVDPSKKSEPPFFEFMTSEDPIDGDADEESEDGDNNEDK